MIMLHFNVLERAVLEDICRQQVDEREVLEGQLATATVTLRKNTGEGATCESSAVRLLVQRYGT